MGNEQLKRKFDFAFFLITFIEAMIIGIAGILPGMSGGVLCVVFGFYRTVIDTLSDPLHKIKQNIHFLVPFALGAAVGFVVLASLISDFMDKNRVLAECLFAGLIIGEIPDLWHDAGKQKRTLPSYIALAAAFFILAPTLLYFESSPSLHLDANFFVLIFAGTIFGLSIVVPGLSFSSTLMALDLYDPLLKGVKNFDFSVLIPIGIGAVLSVLLLSKLVNFIYKKYYSVMSHVIIGIVCATILPILPHTKNDIAMMPFGIPGVVIVLALGVAAAAGMNALCNFLAKGKKE